MSRAVIALAAGGTGGHMFPAEALARALIGRGLKVAMITDSRGGAFVRHVSLHERCVRAVVLEAFGNGLAACSVPICEHDLGAFIDKSPDRRLANS